MSNLVRPAATSPAPNGVATDGSPIFRRRWATLAVLCVTLLLISLDNTVLNVALPSIVRSLGASSSQLQWMVDAYAVVFAGLLLSLGALGDRAGRKWVFMSGLVVFGGGSAFAAWSGSPDRLTVARGVMGIGAAALMPCTLSILTNVFTQEDERVRAIGIWSGATGLGVALGPILGGILLAHFWWGSVFLVNVPVAVLGLIAAIWLVPNSRNPASTRPDPIGAVLSILGGGSLLWGIIEAPSRGWSSPLIVGAIGAAVILIAAFVVWERRIDHPMLPLRFFASRRYSVAIGALALVLFALLGMFFVMTQYLQFVLGYSPLEAGVRIAPVALALLVIAPLSVLAAHRFGSKVVIVSGMALIALGLGLLSRTTVAGTYRDCIAAFLVLGVGVALALAPSTESVMGSLPKEEAGVGSATNDTAMQLGGALGVGVLGTALILRYQHLMSPVVAHAGLPSGVQGLIKSSLGAALAVSQHAPPALGSQLALLARRSFISGMDLALMIATAVVAVAAVLVLVLLPNQGSAAAAEEVPEAIV
ncbi:MAG TPA: DHA2 family efflux MFS transporter permease subunit [Acidimicrobiales bacterium]|jgi:EmrB/QacA subfamily drug resistance transporter|nr:DHA2 family efflux MFS transporter permease subunit [Acidimicrobiales bacterium]